FINPVIQLSATNTCSPLNSPTNVPASFLDTGATVSNDDTPYLSNGWLRVDCSAHGESGDLLAILHQGTSAGQIGVSSNLVTFGGTNVATFSGGAGTNALVINF